MLYVIGIGPGNPEYMTEEARQALAACDLVVGYPLYLEFVKKQFPKKEYYGTPMTREIERCRYALEQAAARTVALVCSGDAGVYGMAGPVLELAPEYPQTEVCVIPGVTAAISGAAVLGAPLMHDFAVISLSDRLTPVEEICRKLKHAAESEFVIALYNPSSKKRRDYLRMACDILLSSLSPDTVCGYVKNAGRDHPESGILTLAELKSFEADMFTTIFVGNRRTKAVNGRMVTPRGYEEKLQGAGNISATNLPAAAGTTEDISATNVLVAAGTTEDISAANVLVAAGTTEGRQLCEYFAAQGCRVYAFVATEYGEEMLPESPYILTETGRRDEEEMLEFLQSHDIRICYDAMHPYAVQAHENMRNACRRAGCVCTRVLRERNTENTGDETAGQTGAWGSGDENTGRAETAKEETQEGGDRTEIGDAACRIVRVRSIREAAEYLKKQDGNILVTTGSRELMPFAQIEHFEERIWVRVLPSAESLDACRKAGIPGKQIIAMHGPFSREMNELLLREHDIRWMVTKDSGKAGGFPEKMEAAKAAGARTILIERPREEEGVTLEELISRLEKDKLGIDS